MCKDCFNLETNTGLVIYSGVDLTLCDNVKITNGEDMTSVVNKIKSCLDFINSEIDITGLTSSTECLDLTGDTLKDILQSIINQTGSCCCEVSSLQDQIDAINAKLNGTGAITKTTAITYCNPASVTKTSTSTQDTYKVNHGFVPPNTILPYFGSETDFDSTGKGINSMKGWAISNGQNGTVNACGNFIRYECTICCNGTGGSDTATLSKLNIPELTLPELSVLIDLTDIETKPSGVHNHNAIFSSDNGPEINCGAAIVGDGIDCGGETRIHGSNPILDDTACGLTNTACQHTPVLKAGEHTHKLQGNATGKLNGVKVGETAANLQSFSIVPKHLKAIPIQWIGQC